MEEIGPLFLNMGAVFGLNNLCVFQVNIKVEEKGPMLVNVGAVSGLQVSSS